MERQGKQKHRVGCTGAQEVDGDMGDTPASGTDHWGLASWMSPKGPNFPQPQPEQRICSSNLAGSGRRQELPWGGAQNGNAVSGTASLEHRPKDLGIKMGLRIKSRALWRAWRCRFCSTLPQPELAKAGILSGQCGVPKWSTILPVSGHCDTLACSPPWHQWELEFCT
jgi:hypothetical protein